MNQLADVVSDEAPLEGCHPRAGPRWPYCMKAGLPPYVLARYVDDALSQPEGASQALCTDNEVLREWGANHPVRRCTVPGCTAKLRVYFFEMQYNGPERIM